MSQIVLYSYYRSSASYRVRIALHLKEIAHEIKVIQLLKSEQKSLSYRELNPSAQVPTLVHGDRILSQSVAIIDYLDSLSDLITTSKTIPLFAKNDAYKRALQLQACEIINSGVQPLHNLSVLNELGSRAGFSQAQKDDWTTHWITAGMLSFEKFISAHAGQYCFGEALSAADCFLVPAFYNVQRFHIDEAQFPLSRQIVKNCLELKAFQLAHPDAQVDAPGTK